MSVWFYLVFCSLIVVLTSDHGRQMVMMFVFLASPFARVEHAELLTVTVINNCTIEVFQQAVRLFRCGAYIGGLLHRHVLLLLVGKK
jgi:hypothetical protein